MSTKGKDILSFRTACRVAFAGFLWVGKFTFKKEDLKDPTRFAVTKLTCANIRFSLTLDYVQLTLKRSKTDRKHEGFHIILAWTGNKDCPVMALQLLLRLDPWSLQLASILLLQESFQPG
jgi:hypothetical protein